MQFPQAALDAMPNHIPRAPEVCEGNRHQPAQKLRQGAEAAFGGQAQYTVKDAQQDGKDIGLAEKDHQHHQRQGASRDENPHLHRQPQLVAQPADLGNQASAEDGDGSGGQAEDQPEEEQNDDLGEDHLGAGYRDGPQVFEGVVVPLHEEQHGGDDADDTGQKQLHPIAQDKLVKVVKELGFRVVPLHHAGRQHHQCQREREQERREDYKRNELLPFQLRQLAENQLKQSPHPRSPA